MPEANPGPRVAYLKFEFLPPSEVFIAEQLKALRRYRPLVVAVDVPDSMGLPPEAVRSLADLGALSRALQRLRHRLGGGWPYLEAVVGREGCALIHAQSGEEGVWGARIKARAHLPLVTTLRGGDVRLARRRSAGPYRRLFAAGDLFLVSSQALRKQVVELGCPDERLRVLPLGVDVERIPFRERRLAQGESVNVLAVGRMVERRGLPYALRAFATVHRYNPRTAMTVIGDGPGRPAIEALLRELGLHDVRLLGAQPHDVVLAEIERAHIFIMPSITAADGDCEGIPVSLLEAQASGLPVIGTWHGGIPEVVQDGHNGYLVSQRNAHALAERLRHLIEHPELWGPFGRAGRAVVEERFHLGRQVATLESCYDELLSDREGHSGR